MTSKHHRINYRFSSELGDIDGHRYITSIDAWIYESEDERDTESLIGKLAIKLVLINNAINDNYPLFDIMDMETYIFKIGEQIFDFEANDLKLQIQEFYDHSFINSDLCFITRIEIKESHRGKGIGKKVIKDIYNRFNSSCGLFVVQAFPLQFESKLTKTESNNLPKWLKDMNLDTLESDFEKAFYQLKSFYQKVGFDHIDGFNELMFLNPALKNIKLDHILFE
jgi:GNAT superfamily N-acetyltransferase